MAKFESKKLEDHALIYRILSNLGQNVVSLERKTRSIFLSIGTRIVQIPPYLGLGSACFVPFVLAYQVSKLYFTAQARGFPL